MVILRYYTKVYATVKLLDGKIVIIYRISYAKESKKCFNYGYSHNTVEQVCYFGYIEIDIYYYEIQFCAIIENQI